MDTPQGPQGTGCEKPMQQRKVRPQNDQALICPRCHSINTKFCYYNNYSLTQPRYICKTCKRYWTQGGSLRNVLVGGGSRKKNKISTNKLLLQNLNNNLSFPCVSHFLEMPKVGNNIIANNHLNPSSSSCSSTSIPHLTLEMYPCIQTPGFGFPVDGNGIRNGGGEENGGKLLMFPFGALTKKIEGDENKGQGNLNGN